MFKVVFCFLFLPLCWTCFGGIIYFEDVLGLFAICFQEDGCSNLDK